MINKIFYLFICVPLLLVTAACANIGNPTGGARDENPPVFVSANPAPGAVNVDRTRIQINFDELVNVKDAFSKVVVSPVSRSVPKVSSLGKRVNVVFDSLQPNTTYTIDFADAIEDNNEANKLQGFAYSFSTGPVLDTLRISGMVLAARDLEPQQAMLVGVTQNLADSAFTRLPFLRVAKTDDRGRFTIRGLAPGSYRVYALNDRDNDYKYANPEEDIAFYDFEISPSAEPASAVDSIFNPLTGSLDSMVNRARTRFLPNDILLRSFNSLKRSQYLTKSERVDSTRLYLKFNTEAHSFPLLEAIGFPGLIEDAVIEKNATNDSLVYWLPPRLVAEDSLRVKVEYLRTDSAGALSLRSDTLKFFHNRPKPLKKGKSMKKPKISVEDSIRAITMEMKALTTNAHEIYNPVKIQFAAPLAYIDTNAFHLEVQRDTVWQRVNRQPRIHLADTLSPRIYEIDYDWQYATKYRVIADTLAAVGIYGKPTRPFSHEFTVKKKDDYCSLALTLSGLEPGVPAFVELLNSGDKPIRTEIVHDNRVRFLHLEPGRYYARVIEDYNGNGLFDTGDYDILLQPDLAYYYPKIINIKKNWDREEQWDVFATAIDLQKPIAVKKNKPAADKRNRAKANSNDEDDYDDEEIFDPTANPFDPNQKRQRNRNQL